jgi:hypothetical protein
MFLNKRIDHQEFENLPQEDGRKFSNLTRKYIRMTDALWCFVQQDLRMKGSLLLWCDWVLHFVQGGSVGIRVNENIGLYFQTLKWLRQRDPLSFMFFIIVVDMLAIMIARAKDDGQVGGLMPHLVEGGVSILQYADDTIPFIEDDLDKAVNMKLILYIF